MAWGWIAGLLGRKRREPPSEPVLEVPEQEALERKLGHHFAQPRLLQRALTHRSHVYRAGQERLQSNERLEFLGDSVLGLIVNEHLFRNYPDRSEGELTKMKSLIVSRAVLGKAAEAMALGKHLIMAPGEVDAGGRTRASILSDAFEAVLGAMYLDAGLDPVRRFVRRQLLDTMQETLADQQLTNYKSLLQERIQARYKTPPRYKVSATSGPDHAKHFVVEVVVRGRVLGRGEGRSKKNAEQRAARAALEALREDPEFDAE